MDTYRNARELAVLLLMHTDCRSRVGVMTDPISAQEDT